MGAFVDGKLTCQFLRSYSRYIPEVITDRGDSHEPCSDADVSCLAVWRLIAVGRHQEDYLRRERLAGRQAGRQAGSGDKQWWFGKLTYMRW